MATGSAILAIALIAGGTAGITAWAQTESNPPATDLPTVNTATLIKQDGYEIQRSYAARVQASRKTQLAFETGGTLLEVAVEEGDRVAAGTLLARLDTRLLRAKREQLVAARSALGSDAERATLALARQKKLQTRGFAADEALDEARLAAAGVSARIAEADAAVRLVDIELDKAVLRAPFDALIGERSLDPGAAVAPAAPVLRVLEADRPRLRVGLPPERAATLERQRTYRFTAGRRAIQARLFALRGDVDSRTRTISALFEPVGNPATEPSHTLFFGELAELELTETVPGSVFEVPLTALAENHQGLWSVLAVVNVGSGGKTAQLRRTAVEIKHQSGDRAWVTAGLDDGARIVADGMHRVVDGERVRLATPAQDGRRQPAEARPGQIAGQEHGA